MFESCIQKQNQLLKHFTECESEKNIYETILDFGKKIPPIEKGDLIEEERVKGCQSLMYLHSELRTGKVYFTAHSDALISAGIAQMLIEIYSGETPETILKCPPDCLKKLNLESNLSPGRSNGLASMHLRMKQDALKFFMEAAS